MGDTVSPAGMRSEYPEEKGLSCDELAAHWWQQFDRWFRAATAAGLPEPNAMVVATADAAGRPSTRTVLLKGYDERGLVFFTNYQSRKGAEVATNPYVSLLFPWHPISRQVVICGRVRPVGRAETEAYFATRPRGSQLGAWASPQSRILPDRTALEEGLRAAARRFPGGAPVPPPPHWGGLRVIPETVEFWQGRPSRLHDRLRYRRTDIGSGPDVGAGADAGVGAGTWTIERLAP